MRIWSTRKASLVEIEYYNIDGTQLLINEMKQQFWTKSRHLSAMQNNAIITHKKQRFLKVMGYMKENSE